MSSPEEMKKSWMRLCKDPRTSVELLENAAYWESINQPRVIEIRLAVARHRSTPSELLTKLSMNNNLAIQIAVAGHPNLSESTAGKLLRKHLRELRRALAGNPKAPLFVMEKLSKDFKDVRIRLARNPGLPFKIMKRMAYQKEPEVRISLAENTNISQALLEMLSRDKEESVRAKVAQHYKIPLGGLKALAVDASQKVRQGVFERALEEYPTNKGLFEALTKVKPSLLAQQAQDQLNMLELRENEARLTAKRIEALERVTDEEDAAETAD